MTSNHPYLIRAVYEWIVDNGLTPYLLVKADGAEVEVPRRYVRDGRIVLNVAPRSVQNLALGNESIAFAARFSGRQVHVKVPVRSVLAVYAKENGRGIALAEEEEAAASPDAPPPGKPPPKGRPRLRVVD